jgi:hypothetical protein
VLTFVAQVADVTSSLAVGGPLAIILAAALVILWKKLEAKDEKLEVTKKLEADLAQMRAERDELRNDVKEFRGQVDALRAENKNDREKLTDRIVAALEGAGKGGKP